MELPHSHLYEAVVFFFFFFFFFFGGGGGGEWSQPDSHLLSHLHGKIRLF